MVYPNIRFVHASHWAMSRAEITSGTGLLGPRRVFYFRIKLLKYCVQIVTTENHVLSQSFTTCQTDHNPNAPGSNANHGPN